MVAWTDINDFVEHMSEGVHNFATNQIIVALTNTAPASETSNPTADGNGILANLTQIAYTNLSSRNVTTSSSSQTAGTYSLVTTDLVLSATGAVATFRYIYHYNDTPTAPADPLMGMHDYGSGLTLANGESLTLDYGANLYTVA